LAYGEDIDIFGISLSKNVGGVSVGSDLNIRQNMPLASIPMVVGADLNAGLPISLNGAPLGATATGRSTTNPGSGSVAALQGNHYSATGDTLHFVVNGLMTFADTSVFDSATLLGEVYYSNLLSLDDENEALYKGKDTYRGIDKADRDNVGIAVNFTPTWYQVAPGVDLTMPVSLNVGIDGTSPVQGGGAKDTGNYALGLGAQVYNKYFVDLKYVDAFGKTTSCNDAGFTNTAGAGGTTPNPAAAGDQSQSGDGATPSAFAASQHYGCYGGGYSSFSGGGAAIEDRGAVYLTFKTTI
jgi:hypothetical protein